MVGRIREPSFWRPSRKCRYALRAVFELARRSATEPVSVAVIARAQQLPTRFLEVILHELKRAGLVESRRGSDGGYLLSRPADQMTVGQVLRSMEPPAEPQTAGHAARGYVPGDGALGLLHGRVEAAICSVCDRTSFSDLVAEESRLAGSYVPEYVI